MLCSAGKHTILARRERPQILLAGAAAEGSSYGKPHVLFTSAEDCEPSRGMADGGTGDVCTGVGAVGTTKSYTVLAEIAQQ